MRARLEPDLGRVGVPETVDPRVIHALWAGGLLPVVSPVASDALGEPVNVNADEAALGLARALRRTTLVYLSDVDGVRIGEQHRAARSRPNRRGSGSTTARSPAAWRSRCAWRWRPPPPAFREVVIAGKARLLGAFRGHAHRSGRATHKRRRTAGRAAGPGVSA